jgi:putative methyltransferase (TIGR04325 family)
VLQCIRAPYALLETVLAQKPPFVIVDRTAFVRSDRDQLTVQRVWPTIFAASYPCWFFEEAKFVGAFVARDYKVVAGFDNDVDKANLPASYFKGFIFEKVTLVASRR